MVGVPTANENMKWNDNLTPEEKYIGVIHVDSTFNSEKMIEAFMATFQPLQDANIMTKQMRKNNTFGSSMAALSGDVRSMRNFAQYGDASNRRQNQLRASWDSTIHRRSSIKSILLQC